MTAETGQKVVAVDFDGVLHRYSRGWQDGSIYDQATSGARELLTRLRRAGCRIVIFTTRGQGRVIGEKFEESQKAAIEAWLQERELPFDEVWDQPWKPFFHVLIDDRALRYEPGRRFKRLKWFISRRKRQDFLERMAWSEIETELERVGIIQPGQGEEP